MNENCTELSSRFARTEPARRTPVLNQRDDESRANLVFDS
jgi:hypothetical protein